MKRLASLIVLLACTPEPSAQTPTLSVAFPNEYQLSGGSAGPGGVTGDAPRVPFGRQGAFLVRVSGRLAGLTRAPTATIEVIDPNNPEVAAPTTLALQVQGAEATGTKQLAYPRAGRVTLRVHALGLSVDQAVVVDTPVFDAKFTLDSRTFTGTVCVETGALEGDLDVTLKDATFPGGSTDRRVALGPGTCDLLPTSQHRSRALVNGVVALGSELSITAKLVGTDHVLPLKVLSTAIHSDVVVGLCSLPASNLLPAEGQAVELVAKVARREPGAGGEGGTSGVEDCDFDGEELQGVPVSFEFIPKVDVLPASVLTDDEGLARTVFLAPKGPSVRALVLAAGVRTGMTFQRP